MGEKNKEKQLRENRQSRLLSVKEHRYMCIRERKRERGKGKEGCGKLGWTTSEPVDAVRASEQE